MRDETSLDSSLAVDLCATFCCICNLFLYHSPSLLVWVIRQVPEWLKIAACLGSNYVKLLFIFQFRFVFPQASTVFFIIYYSACGLWWKTCAINKNLHASNYNNYSTWHWFLLLLLLLLVNEFLYLQTLQTWLGSKWVATVFAVLVFNEQVILFLYLFTIRVLVAVVFSCTMQTDNAQQQQWQQQKSCCLCNR